LTFNPGRRSPTRFDLGYYLWGFQPFLRFGGLPFLIQLRWGRGLELCPNSRLLALTGFISETGTMNDATKVSKWPCLLGYALMLAIAAWVLIWKPAHPIAQWEVLTAVGCVAFGAVLGVLPFILDYRAAGKVIEAHALGAISEKIQNLERLAAQIASCTNQWEVVQAQADKTSAAAKEIAERMANEVRSFNEFQQKMNDSEKGALRLETEKLRRAEGDWLQVLARILDHIFALHTAAAHSDRPEVAAQIAQFQTACRDAARRVGLVPVTAEPGEPFNGDRHQAVNVGEDLPADPTVAETVATGYTFQGRLLRPVVVRLRDTSAPVEEIVPAATPEPEPENQEDQLSLGTAD
jgi:molecular chaperone GrpE (heat shock protein)